MRKILTNKIQYVIIGSKRYVINKSFDKKFSSKLLGDIDYNKLEIRIKYDYPKQTVYDTLVHEIVHGIDKDVFFSGKKEEVCIDLITVYVIENIKEFINNEVRLKDFKEYVNNCEEGIKRVKLLFKKIIQVVDINKELFNEVERVFKGEE